MNGIFRRISPALLGLTLLLFKVGANTAAAQEPPYFVTYSQELEEPGNLEVATKSAVGKPGGATRFGATALELEYGATAWWTSELYLDGQSTAKDSTIFTGFRWENRFRPLNREHFINPVLYMEFENISGADKALLEVVGHDAEDDLAGSNADSRAERKHEAELKLILSSYVKDWNISENFIAEKNLGHAPWEFGYAVGAARPLPGFANERPCWYCASRIRIGAEAYGGLGDTGSLTLRDTSHYVAPVIGWQLPSRVRFSFSPGFGVTSSSLSHVYRIGIAAEFPQIGSLFRRSERRPR